MRIGSSSVPSAATRLVMTPIGSTDGVPIRIRSCSSRYSWSARCSMTSLAAYTLEPTRMNRTTWREMPRGSATRCSVGHSASGVPHGNGISRESGLAETKRGTRQSLPCPGKRRAGYEGRPGSDPVALPGGSRDVEVHRDRACGPGFEDRGDDPPAVLGDVTAHAQQRVAGKDVRQDLAVRPDRARAELGVEDRRLEAQPVPFDVGRQLDPEELGRQPDDHDVARRLVVEADRRVGDRPEHDGELPYAVAERLAAAQRDGHPGPAGVADLDGHLGEALCVPGRIHAGLVHVVRYDLVADLSRGVAGPPRRLHRVVAP